jgi:SAM-dependent methyltransferase
MATPTDLTEARQRSLETWSEMASGWERNGDYIWDVSRHVGEWMVSAIDPEPGQTVLDVAAGPGDTGFVAARLVGDSGRLVSTDFSSKMVEVARTRAQKLGIENVEFKVMDAENMDLPDSSVDAVLCRWGFMLMLDPQAALGECARVVRAGGDISFSVWAGPEKNPWVTLTGMVMTQRGYAPQGDPFGPGGMFSMADHDVIRSMLKKAGFRDARIEDLDVRWTFADFDEFWSFLTEMAGAIAAIIEDLPPEEIRRLQEALKEALEGYRADDGYTMPGVAINASATLPN